MHQHLARVIRGVFGCVCVLQCAPAKLAAQQIRPSLTLADVVQRLERSSPMLAAARASADAVHARIGPATALPDPRAEFAVMNRMLPGLTTMSPLAMNQLTVTQMLPLATRRPTARAAVAREHAATASVTVQQFALRRDAATMLADWWQADTSRAVMDDTRRLLRDAIATAEAMYRAGSGTQAEVLRMHAELTRMSAEWLRMDAMRRSAAASLAAMLDAALDPDSLRAELPATADRLGSASADTMNPRLTAAQRAVDASRADELVAHGMRWPELELGIQLGQRPGTSERMVGVMAGASLPIFAAQRQRQMLAEATAMRRMAEADARAIAAESRAGVAETTAAIDRSRALITLYDATLLPQLQAVRESAAAAYRTGTGKVDAVLDALMAENEAKIARITARADEVRALARIEQLTGQAWFAVRLPTERVP